MVLLPAKAISDTFVLLFPTAGTLDSLNSFCILRADFGVGPDSQIQSWAKVGFAKSLHLGAGAGAGN